MAHEMSLRQDLTVATSIYQVYAKIGKVLNRAGITLVMLGSIGVMIQAIIALAGIASVDSNSTTPQFVLSLAVGSGSTSILIVGIVVLIASISFLRASKSKITEVGDIRAKLNSLEMS